MEARDAGDLQAQRAVSQPKPAADRAPGDAGAFAANEPGRRAEQIGGTEEGGAEGG